MGESPDSTATSPVSNLYSPESPDSASSPATNLYSPEPGITLTDIYKPLTPLMETSRPHHHHPTATSTPRKRSTNKEKWQAGLCGCWDDVGLCLQNTVCPCVGAGLVMEWSRITTFWAGCLVSLVPIVGCCYLCLARTEIREQRRINGSMKSDLMGSFLCPLCVVCQATNEIDIEPKTILNRF